MAHYHVDMPKLAELLASNLRAMRKEISGTQEAFCEATGISQAHLSRLENGKTWRSLNNLEEAILKAGGDPLQLFARQAEDGVSPDARAAAEMFDAVDAETREIVLRLLRREAQRQASPGKRLTTG